MHPCMCINQMPARGADCCSGCDWGASVGRLEEAEESSDEVIEIAPGAKLSRSPLYCFIQPPSTTQIKILKYPSLNSHMDFCFFVRIFYLH